MPSYSEFKQAATSRNVFAFILSHNLCSIMENAAKLMIDLSVGHHLKVKRCYLMEDLCSDGSMCTCTLSQSL